MAKKDAAKPDPAAEAFDAGRRIIHAHPLLSPIMGVCHVIRGKGSHCPPDGWVLVDGRTLHVHPTRRATPEEWVWVLAHALLHLGFGHVTEKRDPHIWNVACCLYVSRFQKTLKLGTTPEGLLLPEDINVTTETKLYETFLERGIPPGWDGFGTAGPYADDFCVPEYRLAHTMDFERLFAEGLSRAVTTAIGVAGGHLKSMSDRSPTKSRSMQARDWFMTQFPLLGALAAAFDVIEDVQVCQRIGVSLAAVDPEAREIYMNPSAGMTDQEYRFVMAHELMHVGLRHATRRQGRDPWLWNVACDYVINAWLVEMHIGSPPAFGLLLDPELKGLSAESVYDRIVGDMRTFRKLASLRGVGVGDMLGEQPPEWWSVGEGLDLDGFYRRALGQGLTQHLEQSRGFLPAGLVEEIQALEQPPISWDVELARWFDHRFAPLEKRRSFSRASRRQSSTPDIIRPGTRLEETNLSTRTFGVVLDTSGSMDRKLLAKALGSIAGYAISRDVPTARVVFCDAVAYDEGYLRVEDIAGSVRIKGRGGTVLQPGVDLLERAEDFPKNGPILIITDGLCDDRMHIRRDHAFLIPEGARLPFTPQGPIFRIR